MCPQTHQHQQHVQQVHDMCPQSHTLFNELVSQLNMAACEAQLEHMTIARTDSTVSTAASCSRHGSLSAAVASTPANSMSTESPVSTDAFQEMLFSMLQEEMGAAAGPGTGPAKSQ